MVKADVKHNYYADLELPPNASIEDVRKAYRKLALQYHPDRNSGREEECVPKFQAIQAANEILGDPSVKQKYDMDRRKAGLFAATGPTYNPRQAAPGNPYAANSPFPPPPRRTQPGAWQGARPHPPGMASGAPPTGADRFTNFPRAAPTARKDAGPDKVNANRAFQAAFGQPPPRAQPQPQPPPPPQPQPRARPPPPPRQESKMPTEEQIRAGMKHRNVPRFDPEAMDSRQAAWQQWNQQQKAPPPPRPGMSRTDSMRTPNRQGFNPSQPGSDEKQSSSHNVHKNRSAEFNRANPPGIRVPPAPTGPPPGAGVTPTNPRSPISPKSQRTFPDQSRPNSGWIPNDQVPYSEGNRNRTPYSSYIHEKTDLADGLRRSASTRDTTKLDPGDDDLRGRARSTSPRARQRASESHVNGNEKKPFVVYSDSEESDPNMASTPEDMEGQADEQRPGTEPQESGPFGRPKKTPTSRTRRPATASGAQSDADQPDMQQKTSANIFNFPHTDRLFTPSSAKSRSEENINTTFSPEGWNGEFTGEPDYFAPPTTTSRKQPSPNPRSARTPGDQTRSATMDLPSESGLREEGTTRPWGSDGTPKDAQFGGGPGEVKFSQEDWKKTFKDASWTWVPPPRQGSPVKAGATPGARKPSQARKASKAPGGGTAGAQQASQTANGADGLDENTEGDATFDDGDAMDIDDTPPADAAQTDASQAHASTPDKGARLYSVPPSAWRQQHDPKHAHGHRKSVGSGPKANNGAKLNTNLDDLRNVEPIAKTAPGTTGLGNFTGMSTTLPFASEASQSMPGSATTAIPTQSQLPSNPKLPAEPPRLSRTSWQAYAKSFGEYCIAFHHFNSSMLAHFAAAENRANARFVAGYGWMEQAGDTSGMFSDPTGFASYAAETQALERTREFWNVGCERHAVGVKAFEKVRERVRKLASDGTLPEA